MDMSPANSTKTQASDPMQHPTTGQHLVKTESNKKPKADKPESETTMASKKTEFDVDSIVESIEAIKGSVDLKAVMEAVGTIQGALDDVKANARQTYLDWGKELGISSGKASKSGGGTGPRTKLSPQEYGAMLDKLVDAVKATPGQGAKFYRDKLGIDKQGQWNQLTEMAKNERPKRIKTDGLKANTTYVPAK